MAIVFAVLEISFAVVSLISDFVLPSFNCRLLMTSYSFAAFRDVEAVIFQTLPLPLPHLSLPLPLPPLPLPPTKNEKTTVDNFF